MFSNRWTISKYGTMRRSVQELRIQLLLAINKGQYAGNKARSHLFLFSDHQQRSSSFLSVSTSTSKQVCTAHGRWQQSQLAADDLQESNGDRPCNSFETTYRILAVRARSSHSYVGNVGPRRIARLMLPGFEARLPGREYEREDLDGISAEGDVEVGGIEHNECLDS
jgi:hypothetical protein